MKKLALSHIAPVVVVLSLTAFAVAGAQSQAPVFPDLIQLPINFGSEGSQLVPPTGRVVTRYITEPFASNPGIRFPTTIAEFGNSLYAVTIGSQPPTPDFVVRLPK